MDNKEKIEYFRVSRSGVRFEIVSKLGYRSYKGFQFQNREDRLFFVRLVDGDKKIEFPFSYGDQYRMFELVMNNIILDQVFDREFNHIVNLMLDIKKKKKMEVKNNG